MRRPVRRGDLLRLPRPAVTTVVRVAGVPSQPAMEALHRLLLGPDRLRAVWACESALRRGHIGPHELAGLELPSPRRSWCELVDPRSESPLETWIRLLALDAGLLPPFVLQHEVTAEGWRYRLDLAVPELRLGVEGDGKAFHPDWAPAVWRDRRRQQALARAGWRVLRFTWWDCCTRPGWVVSELRRELDAR